MFFEHGHRLVTGTDTRTRISVWPCRCSPMRLARDSIRLSTAEIGARLLTKNGKLISMCPVSASRRSVMVRSMPRNDSTEISRSPCRISTKRDMCVPLKLCGRLTYMLKLAMVCCSPADRSLTRTGWLMSLMPTRLMGSSRVSRRACTSSTSVTAVRASLGGASGGVMLAKPTGNARKSVLPLLVAAAVLRNTSYWVRRAWPALLVGAGGASGPAGGAQASLRLPAPPALDTRAEPRRVESRGREAPLTRAVFDEAVGNTELQQRDLHTFGGEQLADRGARPAARGVLLDGHERARPCGERDNQVLVERLDEAHVDERGVERFRDRLARGHQRTERQQRQPALALAPQLCLAER